MGHGLNQGYDAAVLRAQLENFDGRLLTPRDIAGALGWPEREVRVGLGRGRREGWVRSAGSSPGGATLYGFTAPAPHEPDAIAAS